MAVAVDKDVAPSSPLEKPLTAISSLHIEQTINLRVQND